MHPTTRPILQTSYRMVLLLLAVLWLAGSAPPTPASTPAAPRACTSFCLDHRGHAIFGSNYDNDIREGLLFANPRGLSKTGWEPSTTGQLARWTAQYGSLTFNLAGAQMAWAGMNEAGLVISTMWVSGARSPHPDQRPTLVPPLWIQYQLDTCATLQEVIANDTQVRIGPTEDHFLVCDRTGACAAVEFLEGQTYFHHDNALPVKALTNSAYRVSVKAWQEGEAQENSLHRFAIVADRLAAAQPADIPAAVATAFDTLAQASGQATGGTPTLWSIVFDTENLQVHFRTDNNPQIRTVDLARLDFACGTPVQMLDIYAPLSGDITTQLEPFAFDTTLQHTLSFLEQWGGMDISPLEVEVLERGMTSFPCTPSAAPYQEERKPLVSPVVAWAALALAHRLWPLGIAVGLGIAALVGGYAFHRR